MPTIDKSFLVKLVLAVAAAVGLLFAVHAVQARRIPDALLAQAERATAAGKPDAAVHYLRQYLEFRPLDADGHARLADALRARAGDSARADLILLYEKILRLDPTRTEARREALKLSLRAGRFTDAVTHAEALLQSAPGDAAVRVMLAQAQSALRLTDAAVSSYEAAVAAAPAHPDANLKLAAYLWHALKRPADAKAVYDRFAAAAPKNPDAFLARARFLAATAALPPAAGDPVFGDLAAALAVDPGNADALLMTAERQQRHGDLPAAFAALAVGAKAHPADARFPRGLAWLEVNRGNLGGAVATLEDGLARVADGTDLLLPLADLLLNAGDTARTEEVIAKLDRRPAAANKLQAKYLRGRLAMHRGRWADAAATLAALRTEAIALPSLEAQANQLLATCHQKLADPQQQLECLKRVTTADPGNAAARMALGQRYLDAGLSADALREYEAAARGPGATAAAATQAIRIRAARLTLAGGSSADAESLVAEFAPLFGASAEPTLLMAEVKTAAGKPSDAAAVLFAELNRRPGDARVRAALAEAVATAAGVAAGLAVLDDAAATGLDGPEIRLARAGLYARDPAKLRPLAELDARTDNWPDADRYALTAGLADAADRAGDVAMVLKLYRRLAARRATEAGAWEGLYRRAVAAGDAAAADAALAAIRKLEGDAGPTLALCRAWRALAGSDATAIAAARDELAKMFGPTPLHADVCVALGRLHARGGEATTAATFFERAVKIDPARFEPARAYLAHLGETGNADAVAKFLAARAADPKWAGEPFRRLVRGAASKTVFAVAERLAGRNPGWLADAYFSAGMTADAARLATAAANAPAATADDWLRLAVRHPSPGVIDAAKAKLPPPAFAAFAAAYSLTPAGMGVSPSFDTADANRAFVRSKLALHQSRLERTEAVAVLETFVAATPEPWATRHLAMLLAVRGDATDRKRALRLMATAAGATPDEQRVHAAALASLYRYLDGDDRKAALAAAIAAQEAVAADPRDGLALVQLLRAAGRQADSRAKLNALLATDPKNLDLLVAAADELLDANQAAAAEPFAGRLTELFPTDARAVAAVARIAVAGGRAAAAVVSVERFARTPGAAGKAADILADLARRPGVAGTPTMRGVVDSAVSKYESVFAARPDALPAAAGLLAADGRGAAAFELIEKHARLAPARVKATAGLAALRPGGATPAQFAAVRTWLTAARADDPDAVGVMLEQAEWLALAHDYAAAEAAYEAVLKLDPRNPAALNNLAWVLAPKPAAAARCEELIARAVREVGLTAELLDTRARVRIAAKQFAPAEADLAEALRQGTTPLRLFHVALAMKEQSPPRPADADRAFREAKGRGLTAQSVHPDDVPAYRALGGPGS